MSDPKAQVAKEKGNAAFKSGDYPLAIGHYTAALMADARDPTYPLNRAAAYLKLGKNEDAERDCTTVLGLSAGNVKAFFRRGQARVGMGRLTDAQNDFSAILRVEPANVSAQDELKRVTARIQEEKAKKVKGKTPPTISSADSATAPRRRRVPIKIIDPSAPVSSSSATEAAAGPSTDRGVSAAPSATATSSISAPVAVPTPKPTSTPKSGTLEAVSSRSLKPASATAATVTSEIPTRAPIPPALASVAAALQSPSEAVQEIDRDNAKGKARAVPAESFAQAKQARASAKPSRVGGGIFRSSGESTIFAPRGAGATGTISVVEEVRDTPVPVSVSANASLPLPPAPNQATNVPAKVNVAPVTAPTTLFDFNRMWNAHKTPEEKWALLTTVAPAQLPSLCQTALEPALLASMLSVFCAMLATRGGDENVRGAVRAYVDALSRIPRFGTLVLFLSRAEKEDARSVFTVLEATPTGAWQAVR